MTPPELFVALARLGASVTPEGQGLRLRAPAGVVSTELRGALSAQKTALLEILPRLEGMRLHPEPIPCAKSRAQAPGGPGHCFSCNDLLEHAQAYGRCGWCELAVEAFYQLQNALNETLVPALVESHR